MTVFHWLQRVFTNAHEDLPGARLRYPVRYADAAAFRFIYELMGAERILFSVDYPYQILDGVKIFIDILPVNNAEKEAIAFRNVARLLVITV